MKVDSYSSMERETGLWSFAKGCSAVVVLSLFMSACAMEQPSGFDSTVESGTITLPIQKGEFTILQTPETPGWPMYLIPDPALSTPEGETLIFFIRERTCIPDTFNLIQPPPFDCFAAECPMTMRTKEWWLIGDLATAGGPWGTCFGDPNFRVPFQSRFEGDAVPVWVVNQTDLLASFSDGILTIGELEALPRTEGTATWFLWVQQNSNRGSSTPSHRPNHSVVRGTGGLTDNRSFSFHIQERLGQFQHIELRIW